MRAKAMRNSEDVGAETPQDELDASTFDVCQFVHQLHEFLKALLEELVALGGRANDGAENLRLAVGFKNFANVKNPVSDPILFNLRLEDEEGRVAPHQTNRGLDPFARAPCGTNGGRSSVETFDK